MPPSALPRRRPRAGGRRPPAAALVDPRGTGLGIYLHVPFCTVRCGYCDFNTYTLTELGGGASVAWTFRRCRGEGARTGPAGARRESPSGGDRVRRRGHPDDAAGRPPRRCGTAYGSGSGLAPDAEVTTEANPDSVTPESLETLAPGRVHPRLGGDAVGGAARPATLERTHDPRNVARAVAATREAGMQVSVDLIYGTPGESLDDWRRSLETAIALEPDHISAYALVVETGTKLAAQVRRGICPCPRTMTRRTSTSSPTTLLSASRLRVVRGEQLGALGGGALPPQHRLLGGQQLVGHRPRGAQPRRRSALVERQAPERVCRPARLRGLARPRARDPHQRAAFDERVLLGTRLVEGLPVGDLRASGRRAVASLIADGLVDGPSAVGSGSGRPHPPGPPARRHRRAPAPGRLRSTLRQRNSMTQSSRGSSAARSDLDSVPRSCHAPRRAFDSGRTKPYAWREPSCERFAASWSTTRTRSRGRWSPTSARAPSSPSSPRPVSW